MRKVLTNLVSFRRFFQRKTSKLPCLILTKSALKSFRFCMEPEIKQGKEGIAYLLGQSDGTTTLIVSVIRPYARTTPGSFSVSSPAMAKVVRVAVNFSLQVVGQVHTHPGKAYHSEGDEQGARIAYQGYVSIVLPNYGCHLPSLEGAVAYMFSTSCNFVRISHNRINVVPERIL